MPARMPQPQMSAATASLPAPAATNRQLFDGRCRLPACLQVDEQNECPPGDCFEGVDYDREEHGGYTGNEGPRWTGDLCGGGGCFKVVFFVACMWI